MITKSQIVDLLTAINNHEKLSVTGDYTSYINQIDNPFDLCPTVILAVGRSKGIIIKWKTAPSKKDLINVKEMIKSYGLNEGQADSFIANVHCNKFLYEHLWIKWEFLRLKIRLIIRKLFSDIPHH